MKKASHLLIIFILIMVLCAFDSKEKNQPDIVFMIDVSGSMDDSKDYVMEILEFFDALCNITINEVNYEVVTFDTDIRSRFTNENPVEDIVDHVKGERGGGTDIDKSYKEMIDKLKLSYSTNIIIVSDFINNDKDKIIKLEAFNVYTIDTDKGYMNTMSGNAYSDVYEGEGPRLYYLLDSFASIAGLKVERETYQPVYSGFEYMYIHSQGNGRQFIEEAGYTIVFEDVLEKDEYSYIAVRSIYKASVLDETKIDIVQMFNYFQEIPTLNLKAVKDNGSYNIEAKLSNDLADYLQQNTNIHDDGVVSGFLMNGEKYETLNIKKTYIDNLLNKTMVVKLTDLDLGKNEVHIELLYNMDINDRKMPMIIHNEIDVNVKNSTPVIKKNIQKKYELNGEDIIINVDNYIYDKDNDEIEFSLNNTGNKQDMLEKDVSDIHVELTEDEKVIITKVEGVEVEEDSTTYIIIWFKDKYSEWIPLELEIDEKAPINYYRYLLIFLVVIVGMVSVFIYSIRKLED